MNNKSICFSAIVLCVMLTGCDILPTLIHGEKPEDTSVAVTSVSLSKTSTTLTVGRAETLTAIVTPANATNKSLRWNSDDSNIASVTNGVITGKTAGIAVITVTTVDGGKTDSCAVIVNASDVAVTGVSLNKTSTTLIVGGMETLTAIFTPSNATNQNVTWESNNETVATVTNGVITGKALGNAVITVNTDDGGKKASCAVTVSNSVISVTSVSLSKSSISLTVGGTETLTATITPSNATNQNVTWSSSNNTIATVTGGTVTAVSTGNATITVTTADGNKTATCSVTVSTSTTSVTFSSVTANGSSSQTTSALTLSFSVPITGLSAADITLSGVSGIAKGTLSGSNPYTLAISGFTAGGTVSVSVSKTGFAISGSPKTVTIYYYSPVTEVTPSTLSSYLATLPANTASSPHNIILKVISTGEFDTVKAALNGAPNKYVYLDFSSSTITTIPNRALYEYPISCATLTGITIPNSVTSIEERAFQCSPNLASVTIPDSVTSIGVHAFTECTSLISITIPKSITMIEWGVFSECTSLVSVIIGSGVSYIGSYAFYSCTNLSSVTFQGTFRSISSTQAFPGDLRSKYLATGGGIGTYTRSSGTNTWTKQ